VNILKVREHFIDPLTPVHQVSHFMSSISFCAETNRNLRQKLNSPQKKPAAKTTVLLAIILSGDIQVNPGPTINTLDRSSVYPCGSCEEPVNWEHNRALCCDNCSLWYHSKCLEESSDKIDLLGHSNVSWICVK
jgi:hypothetical protein